MKITSQKNSQKTGKIRIKGNVIIIEEGHKVTIIPITSVLLIKASRDNSFAVIYTKEGVFCGECDVNELIDFIGRG